MTIGICTLCQKESNLQESHVLQDYVDGCIAMEAEKNGYATEQETLDFLNSIKDA